MAQHPCLSFRPSEPGFRPASESRNPVIKAVRAFNAAPTAHPPFVGFAISEKVFDFAHVKFLCSAGTIVRSTSTSCIKLLVIHRLPWPLHEGPSASGTTRRSPGLTRTYLLFSGMSLAVDTYCIRYSLFAIRYSPRTCGLAATMARIFSAKCHFALAEP